MSVLIKHKKTHTTEKAVDSLKLEKPSSGSHSSLCLNEFIPEQNPVNTVPVETSSETQPLLNTSELLGGRNVMTVDQPFLKSQASLDNRELTQGISLANAVDVTTPPIIMSYMLQTLCRKKNPLIPEMGKSL